MGRLRTAAIAAATLFVGFALVAPAHASSDYSCSPSWRLRQTMMTGCDSSAILAPGNDTRVNLLLLMFDRGAPIPKAPLPNPWAPGQALFDWRTFASALTPQPQSDDSSSFADGDGSRCRSNDSGAAVFEAAVRAAKGLPESERAALIAARRAVSAECGEGVAANSITVTVASATGQAFATYLAAAQAFYDGRFEDAAQGFATLGKSPDPWTRETALYMTGRVELNRAQVNAFDEYGYFAASDKVDHQALAKAEAGFRAYLRDYPKGLFASSAQGLMRRLFWLGGDTTRLANEYRALSSRPGIDLVALAEEMDVKLLPRLAQAPSNEPATLAVSLIQRMRNGEGEFGGGEKPITLSELQSQRQRFASDPALYDYLLAAHAFYVRNAPAEVIKAIPDDARNSNFSSLAFGRQALRGMALDAIGDRNARAFWVQMLGGAKQPWQRLAIELAIAQHDERSGAVSRVFEADSTVKSPTVREILLINAAGPNLLRQQAKNAAVPKHERDIALLTLLYKSLARGLYRDFVADTALIAPDAATDPNYYDLTAMEAIPVGVFGPKGQTGDYGCPNIRDTASRLATNPKNANALLCLADFMRVSNFDGVPMGEQPPKDQLGGWPSQFPGKPFSRLELYKGVIADPAAAAPDKAYALYRAVYCYGPSGNNSCGGVEVEPAQRKGWYLRLKRDYPQSRWAKDLRYYW